MVTLGRKFILVAFATNSVAMRAQSIFQTKKLSGRLIPIPTELSAQCGLAWRNEMNQKELLEKTITEEKIRFQSIQILDL